MSYSTKEQAAEYMRGWRARNRAHVRRTQREAYQRNRDQYRAEGRERRKHWSPERRAQDKRNHKEYHLRTKYGLDFAAKQKLYDEQEGLCFLCHKPLGTVDEAVVDHKHSTQEVRGLAHPVCNIRLGFIETAWERDPTTLKTMLEVLGVS